MSSTGDALIGQTLDGRYRVLSRIADGGMATVYLAVDERLEREVALKVMRPHLVHDETFVSRFRREARSAAALSHPNVVAVFDQGQDGGSVFLAMEYVPGQTLREVLTDEGPLSPRAAFDVLDPVLQALGAAHAKGLIHRDVKPENVILSETGAVKVADFGLARAVSSQTISSSSGVLLGTVAYLSPEQVERGIADARSDVYAAGLVLLEMLTGTKAFTGETPIHVAYQHVHGGVPVPSSRVESLPQEIDDLVAVATARDPDERPVDASDLLAMVRRTRAGLSAEVLDGRPEGVAAVEAASVPTATAALPVGSRPGRAAVVPRDGETAALRVPAAPLEGVVVGGEGRRQRNWWPAALASVLLAAAMAWFFLLGPGATATVPSVLDRPQAQAVAAVQRASLDPAVVEAFSEDVAPGTVISVDPRVGASVGRGTEVTLTVSKGPERYTVPAVTGMTLAEATRQLQENTLTVGKVSEGFSETVPDGQVYAISPKAGEKVKRGTAVGLAVSKGRQPVRVADYTGKDAAAATRALTAAGLEVDASAQENSDTVPKGSVISQSPRDGTLFKGDKVTLVVSKGPVLVDVPNVVGKQVGDATNILQGLGFTVKVEKALGGIFGTVRFQDPTGGQAPKGSTVTITIV